jgi:hypothetical protein
MGHLVDAQIHAYRVLGFEQAVSGDEVFGQLVLARIIEPTSKLDSRRGGVLDWSQCRGGDASGRAHPDPESPGHGTVRSSTGNSRAG